MSFFNSFWKFLLFREFLGSNNDNNDDDDDDDFFHTLFDYYLFKKFFGD